MGAAIKWALIFAAVAVVAGVLGFGDVAGAAAGIVKFLFFVASLIFVVLLVLGFTVWKTVRNS